MASTLHPALDCWTSSRRFLPVAASTNVTRSIPGEWTCCCWVAPHVSAVRERRTRRSSPTVNAERRTAVSSSPRATAASHSLATRIGSPPRWSYEPPSAPPAGTVECPGPLALVGRSLTAHPRSWPSGTCTVAPVAAGGRCACPRRPILLYGPQTLPPPTSAAISAATSAMVDGRINRRMPAPRSLSFDNDTPPSAA
jgi:hypothetical protein